MSTKRILIIDDDPNIAELLRILVSRKKEQWNKYNYVFLFAQNGSTGIKYACEQQPDLIILDIMMPEDDGFEVARKLRKNSETNSIPILFLSALSGQNRKKLSITVGGNDYVTKPFRDKELFSCINRLLELFDTN